MTEPNSISRLLQVMEDLRHPKTGCPWDREQTFETIAPYTIEEAYEVADAIKKDDQASLKDELGDLLFQVVFYAQMSKENGGYDFNDIADTISEKMISRHPHVFGTNEHRTVEGQTVAWEDQKAQERLNLDDTAGRLRWRCISPTRADTSPKTSKKSSTCWIRLDRNRASHRQD